MTDTPLDDKGRYPISEGMKRRIEQEFAIVPDGKRGALLVIADQHGTRGMFAAKLDGKGRWKVVAGGGFTWTENKPEGFVGVMGSW